MNFIYKRLTRKTDNKDNNEQNKQYLTYNDFRTSFLLLTIMSHLSNKDLKITEEDYNMLNITKIEELFDITAGFSLQPRSCPRNSVINNNGIQNSSEAASPFKKDCIFVTMFFLMCSSAFIRRIVHSQISKYLIPIFVSSAYTFLSRSTFVSNFFCQNSTLVLGVYAYLHSLCRCQKHPLTKMAVRYFERYISGHPGSRLVFFL